jgi:hypothetical protein
MKKCTWVHVGRMLHAIAVLAGGTMLGGVATAGDLNPNGDWKIRWDNTIKYSAGLRLDSPLADLSAGAATTNLDDGDRNFAKGLSSNRMDVLSEFDAQKDGFGIRLSAAGWYDAIYQRSNDNNTPERVNHNSVPYNAFPDGTRKYAGRMAEMLDWFAFGQTDIGGKRASFRVGQHSLLWGTSLFFGGNGIANGMAPVDVYKLNIPGAQAKETIMPVQQLSGSLQLTGDTSLEAYVQFKFKPTRLAPAGSYYSTTDFLGAGSELLFAGPVKLAYAGEIKGPEGRHNIGLALNTHSDALASDFGFYALRYKDTAPKLISQFANARYWLVYPNDIRMLGVSFGRLVGEANVSGEASIRYGQPLIPLQGVLSMPFGATSTDLKDNPIYPTGRTAHMNLSAIWIMGSNALWDNATIVGEIAANHVLSVQDNPGKLDTTRNRTSSGMRVIFTPSYYQVVSGLNLSPSVNLGWAFKGKSMIDVAFPFGGSPDHGGDVVLGLSADYRNKWFANISWVNYLGKATTQPLLDRDQLRLSLQTSF